MALARQLGAHHYIDAIAQDAVTALQQLGGARVILATAPNAEAISALIDGLSPSGTLLVPAAPAEPSPPPPPEPSGPPPESPEESSPPPGLPEPPELPLPSWLEISRISTTSIQSPSLSPTSIGVSTAPCGVVNSPQRARPSVASISNRKASVIVRHPEPFDSAQGRGAEISLDGVKTKFRFERCDTGFLPTCVVDGDTFFLNGENIRLADIDGNPATTADPTWTPLVETPPIPDYDSGHAVDPR